MEKFPIKNLIITIGGGIGVIATFLPWATVSILGISQSVSGTNGDGWFTLALFAAAIVLVSIKFKEELPQGFKIAISAVCGLAALVGIFEIFNVNSNTYGMASVGFGVYLVILAGAACAAAPWLPIDGKISTKDKAKK